MCKREKNFLLILTVLYLSIAPLTVLAYSRYMIPAIPIMVLVGSNLIMNVIKGILHTTIAFVEANNSGNK